ncbi:fatty-acyl-CoA synthase/long-chain acyl-CoA synthetase [Actinomycetospora succinea]|uniref:Fatty-acyl-CoA synthase/long-chain acyl-CoA synthetase n=1 Tax=Actinomycetospora succinea TaxID=663603 RepID=A0A4R6UU46_9PSEU|nr:class I adenylate-forming enzyme family protein [Actinomycetospora succinea]TDQ46994.1 fatty-acyl-CoA synthase/long-chain acyl-CoA synthetase [Actinomycetospora succinea]
MVSALPGGGERATATTEGTLAVELVHRAEEHPDLTFVSFPDVDLTYAAFLRRAVAMAKGLIAAGLRPGGHVAALMTNSPTYVELLFGVHLAGGVLVPLNARFKRRELSYVLGRCDAELLVTTDAVDEHTDFTALVSEALPDLRPGPDGTVTAAGAPRLRRIYLDGAKEVPFAAPLPGLIEAGRGVPDDAVTAATHARTADDTAVLLYTSGTTADPKGCELTHRALRGSWSAFADVVGLRRGEAMWTPCPFFHVGGIGPTVSALVRGAAVMSMSHFDPEVALEHIERRHAEHLFPAFPPLTLGLLRAPGYAPERLRSVRTVLNVAPRETQEMIQALLPAEATLLTDFGMTEGAGMITATALDEPEGDRLGRNGNPIPGIEVRIADPDAPETLVPVDAPGEIQFRGVNAFRAYYRDPEATAATILPGGWVRTGDSGSLNANGSLLFLGRRKDVLKVGGENVSPLEVEALLSTHPEVRMAQIVGRPSARYGEVPVAFVETTDGAECTGADLIAFCRGDLASYKVPREIRFVTSWPMSATKIQKFRLRALLEE